MTIQRVQQEPNAFRLWYLPVLSWAFALLTLYALAMLGISLSREQGAIDGNVLLAVGLILAFAGFVIFNTGDLVTCHFDRQRNQVSIFRIGMRGRSQQVRKLSDLRNFKLIRMRRAYTRLELEFSSGERIPTTPYYVVLVTSKHLETLSNQLNIPLILEEKIRP